MRRTIQTRATKSLILIACVALLTGGSGCSIPEFGPLTPVAKLVYNAVATMINSAFFGASTATGISY